MPRDSTPPLHPRLDALLHAWACWQYQEGAAHLRIATSRFWGVGSVDFDQLVESCDERDVQALDAAVWDLPLLERAALMNRHLQCVWRPNRPDVDLEAVYERARAALSAALRRRGVP